MPESAILISSGEDLLPDILDTLPDVVGSTVDLATSIPAALVAPLPAAAQPHAALPFVALPAATQPAAVAAVPVSATPGIDPQQLVPQQVGDPSAIASLTGLTLLQQLALLQEESMAQFVSSHPDVVQSLVDSPPAAREVQLWWNALGIDKRSDLMSYAPYVVGNLEGVPVSLRNTANRAYLTTTIAHLSEATAEGRSEALDASTQLSTLLKVSAALETAPGAPPRTLLSLGARGSGTAAIVIGDLISADYVSILVPGMFYTVDGQMDAWTAAAQSLYDEQVAWIDELGLADATVATVAWIGYETPSLVNFTSLDLAYDGSKALAKAVNGVYATRGDDLPFLSLVAHSYGSTAAMMALTDYGIKINAISIIGSPGSAAQSASELGVPSDTVYVGEADWDQIKDSAFFGSDPGSSAFGARSFRVEGGTDPLTGSTLAGSTGHDEYLMAGSESLRNLALISLGQGRLVTTDTGSGVSKGLTAPRA